MALSYTDALAALAANVKAMQLVQASELELSRFSLETYRNLDKEIWGVLASARETYWADLGLSVDTCSVCGQPRTTEHNTMSDEEHQAISLRSRRRSSRAAPGVQ